MGRGGRYNIIFKLSKKLSIPLSVPEISPYDGFCDEYEEDLSILVVG